RHLAGPKTLELHLAPNLIELLVEPGCEIRRRDGHIELAAQPFVQSFSHIHFSSIPSLVIGVWAGGRLVRVRGVEPPRLAALEPKSSASASSATPACLARTPGAELARGLAQDRCPVKESLALAPALFAHPASTPRVACTKIMQSAQTLAIRPDNHLASGVHKPP